MSVSRSVSALSTELASLRGSVEKASRETTRLARVVRKDEALRRRRSRLLLDVLFVLYVLTDADATSQRILWRRFRNDVGEEDQDTFTRKLEDRLLSFTLAELGYIAEKRSPPFQPRVYAKADKVFDELKLAGWVHTQNESHGVAPNVRMLWRRACGSPAAGQVLGDCRQPCRNSGPAVTKWAQRFRKRWGLTLAKSEPKERVPVAELQEKDSILSLVVYEMGHHRVRLGPRRGATFWPQNRGHVWNFYTTRDHILTPFLVHFQR
jgi:hypothetical protein